MEHHNFSNRLNETFSRDRRTVKLLTMAYFSIAMIEIMSEMFYYTPLIVICKPMMPLVLMLVYWFASERRNLLVFIALLLSSVTNALFIPTDPAMLFLGVIALMFHRLVAIYLIFVLVRIKDYIPVAIATVPFLLIFFYLLSLSDVPKNSHVLLIVQNLLISLLGGVALSNYMMNDNRKNSWLLISALLFVALQFIVFIERYYLGGLSPTSIRPISMALNVFAFYTFYEFVIGTERSDQDGTAG